MLLCTFATVDNIQTKTLSNSKMIKTFWVTILIITSLLLWALCHAQQPQYQLYNLGRVRNGYEGQLKLVQGKGPYGNDLTDLKFQMFFETETRLHIKILDPNEQRWQVPQNIVKHPVTPVPTTKEYDVQIQKNPFSFKIFRTNHNQSVIFDSSTQPFVFEDQYLQIGTKFPFRNPNLYGLGERVHPLRLDTNSIAYTMFNLDNLNRFRENLYGSHPFYMELRNGLAYGVFFLNSNAMDALIEPDSIKFRTIGGVIDLYFFMGPTPEDVVKQYQEIVGKPFMPPFWSFGWHQCRYGYKSLDEVETVVQKYAENNIPLETIWTDIDYMDAYKDFTWDPQRYNVSRVKQFADNLHKKNQHYIVIVDPAIAYEPGYAPYDEGLKRDVFIKDASTHKPIINKQWPGLSVFPDFTNPATIEYWRMFVQKFITDVPLDGLWLDMNEISCFCDGVCNLTNAGRMVGDVDNPPYVPNNGGQKYLSYKTLKMSAQHHIGSEYNVHNIHPIYQVNATQEILQKVRGRRPMVVTRSSFAGMGRLAAHWLGDNESTWKSMKLSIAGMLNMNIFGIPMVGADICGFMGNTTMELCARWMQLGSFYPFSRNHNDKPSIPQEPYVFGKAFVEMTVDLLAVRYSLLNYYYTLFAQVHLFGGTVVKPLFFEFNDPNLEDLDTQFMVGKSLLVSPILEEGARTRVAYFPGQDNWYDFYKGTFLTKGGATMSLYAPLNFIPVHIRGGTIIPKQFPAMTTTELRQNPFEVLVALNATNYATGELILDDGDSPDTLEQRLYTHIVFLARQAPSGEVFLGSKLLINGYSEASKLNIGQVTVYGIPKICTVTVNGAKYTDFSIDTDNNVLRILNLNIGLVAEFSISFGCASTN
jgi:lysosomal alpha-glucosidase